MTRHASAEELALLAEGELRRRKATKISAHLAGCTQCLQLRAELTAVPAVLSGVPYPPLPATVSVRIESAIRVEVNHRIAEAPATEAGRGFLPARNRRQRAGAVQRGWHLPGLSVPATRLVAAAGAVVLVSGGGYLVASNLTSGVPTSSSSSAAPSTSQPMTAGPDVTYGSPGSQHTIHSVSSSTDFVPKQLRAQALDAYHEAQVKGEAGNVSLGGTSAPSAAPVHGSAASPLQSNAAAGSGGGVATRLAGCMKAVADGRMVVLLDLAKYEGKPAMIIVLGSTGPSQAEVIVTTDGCSATSPNVLTRAPLGHL
jgi:hypothetical protein